MASSECNPRRILARTLVSLNDAELDHYLEEHRLEGGAVSIDVEDPKNLPESFIQRLRDRARGTSNVAQSHAVDLDRVTARLLEVSTDNDALPRPLFSGRSTPTLPPTPGGRWERMEYDKLVNSGGRPLYPIELVDDVAKDPGAYREMLRPWVEDPDADPPDWDVFHEQWGHWQYFLHWQAQNRGLGLPPYVMVEYRSFYQDFRRNCPTYTEAAKNLLARYDFTRPFQFHDDPKMQDKLTTWIEYLVYTCAAHYRDIRIIEYEEPKYHSAWKTLVDTKVLRPFETKEYILAAESAFRHQAEEDMAFKAVKSAEAILISEQTTEDNIQKLDYDKSAASIRIRAAQSRLDAAKESQAVIKRRNDLVTEFHVSIGHYLRVKHEEKYFRARLQWALEQVPLVEAEMNELTDTNPTETRNPKRRRNQDPPPGRNAKSGSQGRIRKRSYDDTADDNPPSKRLRNSYQNSASHNNTPCTAQTKPTGAPQGSRTSRIRRPDGDKQVLTKKVTKPTNSSLLQRGTQDVPQAPTTSPPLRRSARIAARQQILKTMSSSSVAQVSNRITKKQAPQSSIQLQNKPAKFPATKLRKYDTRSSNRPNTSKAEGTSKGRRRNR
ncbi:hypothetical protein GQX73_g9536 [Xylaria multiplex]|uniref:Uncharacterized protein n=1 Tax=Xylaria multiplex TaxID=323545 RepID=A0A7C8MNL1_9PEZI|nr:hypothetical protein GQX73_g9536 [Xylaria multiplex]